MKQWGDTPGPTSEPKALRWNFLEELELFFAFEGKRGPNIYLISKCQQKKGATNLWWVNVSTFRWYLCQKLLQRNQWNSRFCNYFNYFEIRKATIFGNACHQLCYLNWLIKAYFYCWLMNFRFLQPNCRYCSLSIVPN